MKKEVLPLLSKGLKRAARLFFLNTRNATACLLLVVAGFYNPCLATGGDGGIEKISFARLSGLTATSGSSPLVTSATASLTYTDEGEQTKRIRNIITLSVIEETPFYIPSDFIASVQVRIEYGPSSSSVQQIDQTLTVTFDKDAGAKYKAKHYFSFEGAEYVKITVLGITAPVLSGLDTREVLLLQNEMRVTRYFELDNNVTPSSFASTGNTADALAVAWAWPVTAGNNYTQLEWTWVEDELKQKYYGAGGINHTLIFRRNATRVDLPLNQTSFNIPLFYDGQGKLYYRIRAVNIKGSGNRSDGPWSEVDSFAFAGHDNALNWQVRTSFAEDGKLKTVMEYYDGSLRSRQTVTKENITNTTVSAETFYDAQGRPAIQILPTPGMNTVIAYTKNLNLFNGQSVDEDPLNYFDLEPMATPGSATPDMVTSTGSSKYYSASNPEIGTGANDHIPDAEGYPYTVTRYTPDATGRIMAQSGVGAAMKMGSGREMKYYYGSPAQEELNGLFGTEVGNKTHYFKNMVKDANGQMSISYVDMHGRTIATALAGDHPSNLAGLDIENATHYPNQAGTAITRNLLDPATNIVIGNSIEAINSLLVPATTEYNFRYKLTPQVLQLTSCASTPLCYDCMYNLEISITDESGDQAPIVRKYNNISLTPDDNCSTSILPFKEEATSTTGNTILFAETLLPGSYSIRKTLTLSEASVQRYKEMYMTLNKGYCKTEQELIDSVYNALVSITGCGTPIPPVDCQDCLDSLGSETAFRTRYLASIGNPEPVSAALEAQIAAAYQASVAHCNSLCTNTSQLLVSKRQLMLADMMPFGGQYATEAPISDINGTDMYEKYNIFSTTNPATQPFYKKPWNSSKALDYYYDAYHVKDIAIHPDGGYTLLNATGKNEFAQLFVNSWAASLLPHHPEYDRLVFAEANLPGSYNWSNAFTNTQTYSQASAAGYIITTGNTTHTPYNDPFYSIAPSSYKTDIIDWVTDDYRNGWSMWQIAYGAVKCNGITDPALQGACYNAAPKVPPFTGLTTAENDKVWKVFRGLYAAERDNQVNTYIATNVPLADADDLVSQGYMLRFGINSQVAAQSGWDWYPSTPGGPPNPLPDSVMQSLSGESRCHSYIEQWRRSLLQCDSLAHHPLKDEILDEIMAGMEAVCIKGSDAANLYGSSTVAPGTPVDGSPRSFEEVIDHVFTDYHIPRDYYCNPYVIEFPKPYGLGPVFYNQPIIAAIDSCHCARFAQLKTEAAASSIDTSDLGELNPWLLSHYGDTLTTGLWQGLQHCAQIVGGCDSAAGEITHPCQVTGACVGNYHPGTESWSPLIFCDTLQQVVADFILLHGNTWDSAAQCRNAFVDYFDLRFGSGNTWEGIERLYLQVCGHRPGICDGELTCGELQEVVMAFIVSGGAFEENCGELFVDFYNDYFGTSDTLEAIAGLYMATCGSEPNWCLGTYNCTDLENLVGGFWETYGAYVDSTNCRALFVQFFNAVYEVGYPWEVIVAIYQAYCGHAPDVCNCYTTSQCGTPCDSVYAGYYPLAGAEPLPLFMTCGFTGTPCLDCAGLSALVADFKAEFEAPYDAGPVFTGNSLGASDIASNILFSRFINYRTGFWYNWTDYAQAAANASPACDLASYAGNESAIQAVICPDSQFVADATGVFVTDSLCHPTYLMAISLAQHIYQQRTETLLAGFEAAYRAKCMAAKDIEQFGVYYTSSEYHYTLYYYDMAGNLVKTVPPAGVRPDFSDVFTASVNAARLAGTTVVPAHELATDYRYNSLNQPVAQHSPDGGTSLFWYDKLGRLVVSQNAQQEVDDKYSYTLYDDLGRITEVGQKPQATPMTQTISRDPEDLNDWIITNGGTREQITFTQYDLPYGPGLSPLLEQRNLRNRVSFTATKKLATDALHYTTSFYTYDIHGNVDTLLQDYKGITEMDATSNRFKLVAYNYDLISGKVNGVSYQPGKADAFYHRYEYDAENRLTSTWTSRDSLVWERDADYRYYKHGPLSRTELGQLRVQGMDYAYTLQGWLKGVNSTTVGDGTFDIAQDGFIGRANSIVGRDVLGFALHYYDDGDAETDYKAIGGTSAFARPPGSAVKSLEIKSLYNGNIAAISINNAGLQKGNPATTNALPLFYNYGYDQLNRIVSLQAGKGLNATTNEWDAGTLTALTDYKEAISYDPNGNILTYSRKGAPEKSLPADMDNLAYNYYSGTNRLHYVDDAVSSGNYSEDIDDQSSGNYTYDAIGNLVTDAAAGITRIGWTLYGKIDTIEKSGDDIYYTYDAAGNRISKKVGNKTTIYVRDAQGNMLSVYEKANQLRPIEQVETHLYGSSRLGILGGLTWAPQTITLDGDYGTAKLSTFTRGEKLFELSNHLGNVLVTVNDKKLQHHDGSGGVDYYNADIATANDYYPFGMGMPGRKYTADDAYRYGFNGKENDNEVKGEGNQQDYGMRIYDPRLGKFLSVDPITKDYPWYTPYQFAGNIPIWAIDLDGAEPLGHAVQDNMKRKGYSWLSKTNDERVKYNLIGGDRMYKFDITDAHGDPYSVIRKETDYVGFANMLATKYEYFYLDGNIGNPQSVGTYSVKHTDGSVETKGAMIPFETRGEIDARQGKEVSNIILGSLGVGLVAPFVAPAIGTERGLSMGFDYLSQVGGNYLSGKRGLKAWGDVNVTSVLVAGINPTSSWKGLIKNNLVSNAFSYSATDGYNGLGSIKSPKDMETVILQSALSTLAGRVTSRLDLGVKKLNIRLEHVNKIQGSRSPLSVSLQNAIRNYRLRAGAVGTVTGVPSEALNNSMEKP